MSLAKTLERDEAKASLETGGGEGKMKEQVFPRLLLMVLFLAVLVAITAGDMVVAVLPLVAGEFGSSAAQLGWVVTGYLLVLSVGIPLYGRISDFFPVQRVFPAALLLFAVGSLVCALAPNLPALVAGRVVQAAGAAAIPVLSLVAVTRAMPTGGRGFAVGLIASGGGVGIAVGPALGGVIGENFGWSGLFWISMLCALSLIPGAIYSLPDDMNRSGSVANGREERPGGNRLDLAGGIFLGLAAGLLLFGLTQGQTAGLASFSSWGVLAGAALSAGLFAWRTIGAAHPFVPRSLFENRVYAAAVTVAFLSMFVNVSALVLVPLLVVGENELSAGAAGLVLAPGGTAVAVLSPVAGRLSDLVGAKPLVISGLLVMGLSTLFVSTFAAGASPLLVAVGILGMGAGFAFANSPANNAAVSVLADEDVGAGMGIFQGASFFGAGAGPAVVGAIIAARKESGSDGINPLYHLDAAPFSDAFLAMTVAVIFALTAAYGLRNARGKDTD